MSRFDYVKYDDTACTQQNSAKSVCSVLESFIDQNCNSPRAKALALTKLEECFMWIGKAIRDDQILRNGCAELKEGRINA